MTAHSPLRWDGIRTSTARSTTTRRKCGSTRHGLEESHYRYYETELYFGDTWKVTPSLTLTYGVRWQNYSVPYEMNGIESVPNLSFDQYFNARIAQSAAGVPATPHGPVPSYVLGGNANNGPGYFSPSTRLCAPSLLRVFRTPIGRQSLAAARVLFTITPW